MTNVLGAGGACGSPSCRRATQSLLELVNTTLAVKPACTADVFADCYTRCSPCWAWAGDAPSFTDSTGGACGGYCKQTCMPEGMGVVDHHAFVVACDAALVCPPPEVKSYSVTVPITTTDGSVTVEQIQSAVASLLESAGALPSGAGAVSSNASGPPHYTVSTAAAEADGSFVVTVHTTSQAALALTKGALAPLAASADAASTTLGIPVAVQPVVVSTHALPSSTGGGGSGGLVVLLILAILSAMAGGGYFTYQRLSVKRAQTSSSTNAIVVDPVCGFQVGSSLPSYGRMLDNSTAPMRSVEVGVPVQSPVRNGAAYTPQPNPLPPDSSAAPAAYVAPTVPEAV